MALAGKGAADGISVIVRYQDDINRLQDMLKVTMGRVREIERWV